MMYIFSHNPRSKGARALARTMGIQRIRHENSRFRGNPDKVVINWGASQITGEIAYCQIINHPHTVGASSNKLSFLNMVDGEARIPRYTTDMEVARGWLQHGSVVVERHLLRGSEGRGIVIVEDEAFLSPAPLYTRYVKKRDEYRVHIRRAATLFPDADTGESRTDGGVIFDIQKKALRNGVEHPNWRVRNHANGFIYMRQGINVPTGVRDHAVRAFNCLGLDFGAVDVIWNNEKQRAYVLEINTAPGLEGTTLESYAEIFRSVQ